MGITTIGGATKTIILDSENHKQTVTFVTDVALKKGQPVKMVANGHITAWAKADLEHLNVGFSAMDVDAGEETTVWTRGYGILRCLSNAAQDAGPCTFEGFGTGDNAAYPKVSGAATATNLYGWALDNATAADQIVRVLVKN